MEIITDYIRDRPGAPALDNLVLMFFFCSHAGRDPERRLLGAGWRGHARCLGDEAEYGHLTAKRRYQAELSLGTLV